jgi:hypothetical protein
MLTVLALVACHRGRSISSSETPANAQIGEDVDAPQWERERAAEFVPIDTRRAVLHGVIRRNTPDRFEELMQVMPDVQTLVMADGPGFRSLCTVATRRDASNGRYATYVRLSYLREHGRTSMTSIGKPPYGVVVWREFGRTTNVLS